MQVQTINLPLKDIYLPDAVTGWPPAIGWWLLLFAVIALLFITYTLVKRHKTKWGYRKAAQQLLNTEYNQWQNSNQYAEKNSQYTQRFIESMLAILKRTAISAYPHANVTALFGQTWISFLNQQTHKKYFNSVINDIVLNHQYQPHKHSALNKEHIEALYTACQQWIKQHHTTLNMAKNPGVA